MLAKVSPVERHGATRAVVVRVVWMNHGAVLDWKNINLRSLRHFEKFGSFSLLYLPIEN